MAHERANRASATPNLLSGGASDIWTDPSSNGSFEETAPPSTCGKGPGLARMLIELSDEIHDALSRLAEIRGQSEREIIEDALEHYVAETAAHDDVITDAIERAAILEASAGMWKDRTDLPDVRDLRDGWEKRLSRLFGTEKDREA